MPTEQLELGADKAMFGAIGHQLVPKQMRIDTLGNPCRPRVLFDNLAETSCGVWPGAVGFEEVGTAVLLVVGEVLREFATEAGRKEARAILVAFALRNADLAGVQSDIGQTEVDEFGIAYSRKEQEFEHDPMRQLLGMPDGLIERDQLGIA